MKRISAQSMINMAVERVTRYSIVNHQGIQDFVSKIILLLERLRGVGAMFTDFYGNAIYEK